MNNVKPSVVSIIPYKILPAKLGGEKGIALFSEYLGRLVPITGVTTRNNDVRYASGYKLLNVISNSKLRYINVFLYFLIRKVIINEKATHLLLEHPYFGWLGWITKATMPVKLLVHSHNIEYMRSKSIGRLWWKALKWYEAWTYKKADCIFFISEDDRDHAIQKMGISPLKSEVITYGIEQSHIPEDMEESRGKIKALHAIKDNETILLFNGALYHSTNYDALNIILEKINPFLIEQTDFNYKIIVCGKGLPAFFNDLKSYADKNIIYAGFVDDVSLYFKAADIFLNPILAGGGVKTKAIEALAMDCTVVSTELGAMGINRQVCGNKLYVVREGEWKIFGDMIISRSNQQDHIPDAFFDYYYWGNIVKKVLNRIS